MSAPEAGLAQRRRRLSHAERLRARRRRRLIAACAWVFAIAAAVLAAAFWSNLHHAPTGQVVAVVDGSEITLQDLQSEARARGVSFDDVPLAGLLDPVVDRTLLAHEARALSLDRRPTYPVDHHRIEQLLLAKQLTDQLIGTPVGPSQAQVAALIASEPFLFEHRQRLRLAQIRFEADDALMTLIGDTPTITALRTRLKQLAVPNEETVVTADSADLDAKLNQTLLTLPPDGVLTARQGSTVVADALLDARPTPTAAADSEAGARRLIEQRQGEQAVKTTLQRLRRKAKILYQAGVARP